MRVLPHSGFSAVLFRWYQVLCQTRFAFAVNPVDPDQVTGLLVRDRSGAVDRWFGNRSGPSSAIECPAFLIVLLLHLSQDPELSQQDCLLDCLRCGEAGEFHGPDVLAQRL